MTLFHLNTMNHPPTIQRSKKDKPMKHKTCIGVRIFALLTPAAMAMAQGELAQVRQDFSTDPGWEGVNNRVQAKPNPVVQDFGFSPVSYTHLTLPTKRIV